MSQVPSGGPVVVPFVADRSQLDAFLSEIKKGYDVPLRAQWNGPAGPGGASGGGSMAVAQASGPTTFASGGGGAGQFVGPAGSGSWAGPAGSYGFTMNASYASLTSASGGTGGNQLNQAASQLAQAVNQLSTLIGRMNNAPIADPSPGLGGLQEHVDSLNATPSAAAARRGGGGRFLGLSTRGLARYVGAGFLAHEALNVGQAARDYHVATSLAGGDPAQLAQAEIGLRDRIASIPILGQAADLITDPLGTRRIELARTMQQAQLQNVIGRNALAVSNTNLSMAGEARAAGMFGIGRQQQEIENRYDATIRGIEQQRMDVAEPIAELARTYEAAGLSKSAGVASARYQKLDAQFNAMRQSAAEMKAGAELNLNRDVARTRATLRDETQSAQMRASGDIWGAKRNDVRNSLLMDVRFADPALRTQIAARANAQWAEFNEQNEFDAGSAGLSAQAAQLMEGRNARGAARTRIEEWYRNATRGQSPDVKAKLGEERESRIKTSDRDFDEHSQNFLFGLSARGRSLDFQLGAMNPLIGRLMGAADQTFAGGLQDAAHTMQRNDMSDSDKRRAAQLQMDNARKELQYQIRDYYAQMRPTEVSSINQVSLTGNGGNTDTSKFMEQMAKDIAQLATTAPDLKRLIQLLQNIVPN